MILWVQHVPLITWVSCPGCFPSQTLVTPGQWETEVALMLCNQSSVMAKTLVCCQRCSSHKHSTIQATLEKSWLHLSQSQFRAWNAVGEILKLAFLWNNWGWKCRVQSVRKTILVYSDSFSLHCGVNKKQREKIKMTGKLQLHLDSKYHQVNCSQ